MQLEYCTNMHLLGIQNDEAEKYQGNPVLFYFPKSA